MTTTHAWEKQNVKARRLGLLVAIGAYWQRHQYAPAIRDLQKATGITSSSVVQYNLTQLKKARLVAFATGVPRSLRLTPAGWRKAELTPPCCLRGV